MAQSIRISDEFYELTQAVSSSSGRSLAQPLEYWARLGARVDLGITAAQTLALLNEQPRSSALMSEAIAARHAKDAADVERGHRHATSLIVMPKAIVQSAKLGFPKDAFGTVRAW